MLRLAACCLLSGDLRSEVDAKMDYTPVLGEDAVQLKVGARARLAGVRGERTAVLAARSNVKLLHRNGSVPAFELSRKWKCAPAHFMAVSPVYIDYVRHQVGNSPRFHRPLNCHARVGSARNP